MSDDTHLAARTAADTVARANSPNATELLESLAADYKAGRLPDEARAEFERIRDEYLERNQARIKDAAEDIGNDMGTFVKDVQQQLNEYGLGAGSTPPEVVDSRAIPVVAEMLDGVAGKMLEPIIDAAADVVHDTFDVAGQLLELRVANDPEGIYAPKLDAALAELDHATEVFDEGTDRAHDNFNALHEHVDALRSEADAFHAQHEPVQVIMSTTVDPHLPEQMAEETGEGAT